MYILFLQVKKTMEATLQTIQDMVTIEDFDVTDCFHHSNSMESVKSTVSESFMSKPSLAKRRANQQETEQFYFTVNAMEKERNQFNTGLKKGCGRLDSRKSVAGGMKGQKKKWERKGDEGRDKGLSVWDAENVLATLSESFKKPLIEKTAVRGDCCSWLLFIDLCLFVDNWTVTL